METDLVRTLKQLINARSIKAQQKQDQSSVTIFGQKLTAAKIEDQDEQPQPGSEKLPPTAILHLKELYEQHIKKRKARYVENGDALATLPLLNAIQDKENVGIKRQRTGLERFCVSSSQQAPSCFPAPPAAAFEEMEEDPSRNETEKGASLTVFYNGLVYVYEDIPADKAQAIMVLAGNSSTASSSRTVSSDTTPAGTPPKEARASAPVKRAFTLADLPQARKASLQRFLVKRKERLVISSDKMKRKSPPRGTSSKSSPDRKAYIEEAAAQAGLVLSQ